MARDPKAVAAAIRRRLQQIPEGVQREVKTAIDRNADDMVGLAQRLAPVLKAPSSKRQPGELRNSIHKEPGDSPLGAKVVAGNSRVFWARFVEFGTRPGVRGATAGFAQKLTLERGAEAQGRARKVYRSHPGTPAQPFFFPAYRALKKGMKARVARATTKAVKALAR